MAPLKLNPSATRIIDHIRSALRACFNHPSNTSRRRLPSAATIDSLVKATVAVALGLRVAHLVDVAHLSSDQINQLIALLRQEPQCQSLLVLQFKDRYMFLCHRHELEQHVEATLNDPNQWIYLDIRGSQGPPTQRPCPEILLYWLRHRLQPFLMNNNNNNNQDTVYYSPVVPSYMVALTGWLLEYPTIYMTHDDTETDTTTVDQELDEWEMVPNCLGDRRLSLVRVWLHGASFWQDYMLLSYTYPEEELLLSVVDPITTSKSKFQARLEKHQQEYHRHHQPDNNNNNNIIMDTRLEIVHEYVTLDRVAL